MFQVDPASYRGVFVLPSDIAENYLHKTSAPLLKVILFAYKNADRPFSVQDAAAATGLSEAEASDALSYWAQRCFLQDKEKSAVPAQPAAEQTSPAEKPPEKKVIDLHPQKPTYAVICKRIQESPAVRELFNEAQLKLGRTIGTADQGSLLLLHDYYGLPVEIILTLCEYARTHGKANNISYIYTVGVDWSRREIDTLELADAEFKKIENTNAVWTSLLSAAGLKNRRPTLPQQKYLAVWTQEWHFSVEMLTLAYEEMSRHTDSVSFPYMNKILAAWQAAGIKTPEQAAEREKTFLLEQENKAAQRAKKKPQAAKTAAAPETPASYDIDRAISQMNTTVPTLKKKEKR